MPIIDMSDIQEAVVIDDPTPAAETPEKRFITANTTAITLQSLKQDCTVPVFTRDNEVCISHPDFIEAAQAAVSHFFSGERVEPAAIRVSHPIKGRRPEAIRKPADQLTPEDKTLYYQRMAFSIEIPTICEDINGNRLNLSLVGVKSYHLDNLNGRLAPQKFSFAVGFTNQVCTNLCIFGDGYRNDVLAVDASEIYRSVLSLLQLYDMSKHLNLMRSLTSESLTESQFALLLGRMRLYNYMPVQLRRGLPKVEITDNALNAVARAYYTDPNFAVDSDGELDMWNFYNLLTGSITNSYIDLLLSREVNALDLSLGIAAGLRGEDAGYRWFLS